jgi:hypothetical protein
VVVDETPLQTPLPVLDIVASPSLSVFILQLNASKIVLPFLPSSFSDNRIIRAGLPL